VVCAKKSVLRMSGRRCAERAGTIPVNPGSGRWQVYKVQCNASKKNERRVGEKGWAGGWEAVTGGARTQLKSVVVGGRVPSLLKAICCQVEYEKLQN